MNGFMAAVENNLDAIELDVSAFFLVTNARVLGLAHTR